MVVANDFETIDQSSSQSVEKAITNGAAVLVSSPLANVDENEGTSNDKKKRVKSGHIGYNPKKPKWWTRLGNNCRDATKSQKRAMRKILDGEDTSKDADSTAPSTPSSGLRLPPVPYGSKLDWNRIFPSSSRDKRDIWLELGFGRGENLQALLESKLWNEMKTPNETEANEFYLVGAEVSGVGIGCLCKRIEKLKNLQRGEEEEIEDHYTLYRPEMDPYSASDGIDNDNTTFGVDISQSIERNELATNYSNRLRIHTGDGYKLLPKIPDGSLTAILITFPDPFPKETDVNYRLVQHQTLIECHRILRKENGRLFLATDHDGYHEWCHKIMHEINGNKQDGALSPPLFKLEEPCPNRMEWLPAVSRYEQKGWDEGRSTKLTSWLAI